MLSPPSQNEPLREHDASETEPLARDSSEAGTHVKAAPLTMNSKIQKPEQPIVRYRKTPFWLLGVYLITLIVPWVLICVLDKRPLTAPTYHDQRGMIDLGQWVLFWRILAFVLALRSISAILTVPITTAILGYAAVTYAQKRHDGQKLSIAQLFALSDRGWTDITVLWRCFSNGRSSALLWWGVLLVLIGAVQQPLQTGLVRIEPVLAVSCIDTPRLGLCGTQATTVGLDADPWAMALVDHRLIIQEVTKDLVTLDDTEAQANLWVDDPHTFDEDQLAQWHDTINLSRLNLYGTNEDGQKVSPGSSYFVSSLLNGTSTGVLREHALRLNSSVTCQNVTQSDFPASCAGSRPLSVEIQRPNLNISVCVPGEVGRFPWTLSRNRQNIEEELFIDFQHTFEPELGAYPAENFTMHCTASTSRGYFELGNYMNDYVYGPLLDKWPSNETIERHTNDFLRDGARPTEMDNNTWGDDMPFEKRPIDPFGIEWMPVSGPLMMAANALFGNTSFLQLAYEDSSTLAPRDLLGTVCNYGSIPFSQAVFVNSVENDVRKGCWSVAIDSPINDGDDETVDRRIDTVFHDWMTYFAEPWKANDVLDMSMFVVNRAVLKKTLAGTGFLFAREIYSSPGTVFAKPTKSLGSTIAISIVIFLQSAGLVATVWYSRKAPTWTSTFDSMAVARIGRALKEDDLPPFGPVADEDRAKLTTVNALVGIVYGAGEEVDEQSNEASEQAPDSQISDEGVGDVSPKTKCTGTPDKIQLGLGGEGKIDKSHAPRRRRASRKQPRGNPQTKSPV